ncbi:MAG: translation elongation factor Ts [Candidatus Terrybacteria bacterium RIFCSPHIGHO2_01_FULL_48_17]|uniref:Elongation factor Ts n=1 Tax=Candidatus Terrybacteria bacterium RIFCSPHIGHO2_01_FULL_48_17 TaxID=1802362 RepID=A0A1G2PIN4_9BACT|nr:MAG: translation elongation factor Ts [Candidatus Terrybacteria bacterium RIFCSPHIGHO2_01_FULL_48_17]OHA53862.1 MAG: translation elongation factor Ts [Candidatus Terrybacteria bacterium RIFCSPLOWO2_01_FULL_48_14]
MNIALVKELRARTQASLSDCQRTLQEAGGDLEKAIKLLRTRGKTIAAQKMGRTASSGIIEAYIHGTGALGVLVELRTETDFVARSEQFKALAHDLALHIAAAAPHYMHREDIPREIIDEEKKIIAQEFEKSGKSSQVIEKIAEGKIAALAKEIVLMEQEFVKNPDQTVSEVIAEAVGKFGEKIEIGRFARIAVGE